MTNTLLYGKIENVVVIRSVLSGRGYTFETDAESEVVSKFFDHVSRRGEPKDVPMFLVELLILLRGDYAISMSSERFPGLVMLASSGITLYFSEAGDVSVDPCGLKNCRVLSVGQVAVKSDVWSVYDQFLRPIFPQERRHDRGV